MPFTFNLGGVDFQDFEIPEEVSLGGRQMVALHKLIGGDRVADTLGRDDAPITWSGRFRGSDAVDRCLAIDALRTGGQAHGLIVGPFQRTVVVEEFTYRPQKLHEIPYSISLLVLSDDSAPLDPGQGPTVDDMMASDMADLNTGAASVNDPALTANVGSLQTAVSAVPSFAGATTAQINSVLAPLGVVNGRLRALINTTEAVIEGVSGLGGVVPGNPAAQSAASLINVASAFVEQPQLYGMLNLVGRMTTNLGAIRSSGAQVTAAGGDLYHLAAQAYGDASEWATIAQANGLSDPILSGLNTILVPPSSGGTDGVLQP